MKQRIISAMLGLVLLVIVFILFDTPVLNVAVALIAVLAVFEILHSTGYVKNKVVLGAAVLYGAAMPFYDRIQNSKAFFYVTLVFLALLFGMLLFDHQKTMFSEITTAGFIALIVPLGFSMLVYIRDTTNHGLFFMLLACVAAWVSDTAAYFVGRKFGKHKMCPLISPHKTIEGAVGGVFFAVVFFILFCWGYTWILGRDGVFLEVSYISAAVVAAVCSVAGICGDLLASVIKRQAGIKDFGTIMPGHGGIMDRFDSFLLVVPTLYLLTKLLPILQLAA